ELPTADLLHSGQHFYALLDGEAAKAFGGYYRVGEEALLRSVIVGAGSRREGHGRRIVGLLLNRLRDGGVKRAWLLTTTAQPFFQRFGVAGQCRGAAPPEIAASSEFSTLCPASAVLMWAKLA